MDSEIQLDCESQAMEVRRVRVLELFSGVGGMHRALEGEQGEVVAAMDINTVSNEIYLHNHPGTNLLNRCIEAYKIQVRDRNAAFLRNIAGLTLKELERLAPTLVLMSPPCQVAARISKMHTNLKLNLCTNPRLLSALNKCM